ncbi:MAG: TIGR01777 family oxidoreductase [Fimbriimonadaceae bacterium]|nr:TIGR01777 family oxidoreductase [Fimbriimonadaceae bacterium]
MSRVVLAGGSGFIGRALVKAFNQAGHECVVLSRGGGVVEGASTVRWDLDPDGAWTSQLDGAEALVNLCGAPVSKKWTDAYRREIRDSRIVPTKALGEAVGRCGTPPKVWVNISGSGFYGDRGDTQLSETAPVGDDFLAEVSAEWEATCLDADTPRTRKFVPRLGVVLAKDGGAFPEFKKVPFGGIGSGKQWISWVHLADVCAMALWALKEPVEGTVNCCAPEPVTNARFFSSLLAARGLPPVPPMPELMFLAAAAATGSEASLALTGQRVLPVLAEARGFRFKFPTLESAFADLLA